MLEQRYDRVRKRGRKLASLSPAELHRLRIAIKKFRYATDFFAGLYEGKRARATLKRLARLQDILGAINDAATVRQPGGEVLHGAQRPARGRGARHTARVEPRPRRRRCGASSGRAWKAFRAAEKFW